MIVVEGYIDALATHQTGIVNTVALMGTAISELQISALKRRARTVVLMLDGDDAGAQAVLRAGARETLASRCSSRCFRPMSTPPLWCNKTVLRRLGSS